MPINVVVLYDYNSASCEVLPWAVSLRAWQNWGLECKILKKSFSFLRNHTRSQSKCRGSRDALQYGLKIGTYCCKNRFFLAL